MKPGVYERLPMPDYLKAPALSAGVIHTLNTECPHAAWLDSHLNSDPIDPDDEPDDDTDASDIGSVSHQVILEDSESCCVPINPQDHPNEKGGGHARGWTNKSIKAARDAAREAGKIPLLPKSMRKVRRTVAAARGFIDSLRKTEPAVWAALQPDGGRSELSLFADDDGILCRARPDRISNDRRIVVHLKTSARSVEPESWSRTQMSAMGYWLTAAWYRRVVELACGVPDSLHFFLVVGQKRPLCSLIGVDPAGFAHGEEQRETGLSIWRQCEAAGHWPGFPNRAVYPEVPAYEIARWQDRTAIRDGIPYSYEQLTGRKAA